MNRVHLTIAGLLVALAATLAAPSWAADSDANGGGAQAQDSAASASQPLAVQALEQSTASTADSSNIIGYQPIPAVPDRSQYLASNQNQAYAVQQYAMAPAGGGPLGPQQAPSLESRAPRSNTYDYQTWVVGSGPYTLGRDDMIHIVVRNQPEFSGDFIVGPEGEIQYSYLGDVVVLGQTKEQVEELLRGLLDKYVRNAQVTVNVVGYNSKAVYIVGEVGRPGKYVMRGDIIKLREAIIAAGLPTHYAALRRTTIVKPDLTDPKIRKIDLKRILYKGKLQEDIDLYPGEIVVVPSTVLHNVDVFLSDLLNPVTRAAAAAALGAGI